MVRVFLTGAGGMLGNSILRELLKRDFMVTALYLPKEKIAEIKNKNFFPVIGNILDPTKMIELTDGIDFIINAAASTSVWPSRNELTKRINIDGVLNLVSAAKKNNIKRFIHIGTANSFAPGSKENPGVETNPYDAWKFKLDYIDSKYEIQKILLNEHKNNNFPILIINPGYMIGPFDYGPSSGKMILNLFLNKIPGYVAGGKSFVCSKDVASAAVNGLSIGRIGECYIAGGENLSYKEFFMKVNGVLNRPFKLKRIPSFFILTYGLINTVIAYFTRKAPDLSFPLAKIGLVEQYYSSEKIRRELQMPNTPIEKGITECIEWFKENKYC